jgi:hypothetical protein
MFSGRYCADTSMAEQFTPEMIKECPTWKADEWEAPGVHCKEKCGFYLSNTACAWKADMSGVAEWRQGLAMRKARAEAELQATKDVISVTLREIDALKHAAELAAKSLEILESLKALKVEAAAGVLPVFSTRPAVVLHSRLDSPIALPVQPPRM